MSAIDKTKPPGTALERVRPQERALVQAASELGIRCWEAGGIRMIDLSDPELADRYNVLSPAAVLMQADPNFTPMITALKMDPREGAGDVYAIESTGSGNNRRMKFGAPLKTALEKLGEAAGIIELPPIYDRRADGLTVTGGIKVRRPDGTYATLYGTREWVTEREHAKVVGRCPTTKYNSDEPLSEPDKAAWIKKEWTRVQEFSGPMTESKAYLRAYRKALKLKQKYTPEELQKPFLVVSTTFTPDTSDPAVVRMLMTSGQQATALLYGPAAVPDHDLIEGTYSEEPTGEHDAPEGVDPETGEIAEPARPRPAEDPVLPRGPHADKPLSEVARTDPDYVVTRLVGSDDPAWGLAAEAWLAYWAAEGDDEHDGVQF